MFPVCLLYLLGMQRPRRVAMRSMREANTPRQRKESRKVRERDRGSELYRSNESFSDSYPVYGLDEWSAEQLASSTVACLDSIGGSLRSVLVSKQVLCHQDPDVTADQDSTVCHHFTDASSCLLLHRHTISPIILAAISLLSFR